MKKELVKGNYASREELVKQIIDMTNAGLRGSDISELAGVSKGVVHYLQKTNGVWERVNKVRSIKAENPQQPTLFAAGTEGNREGQVITLDPDTSKRLEQCAEQIAKVIGFKPHPKQSVQFLVQHFMGAAA